MTLMLILIMMAVALMAVMMYAQHCWSMGLADRMKDMKKDIRELESDMIALEGKANRIINKGKWNKEDKIK